MRDKVLQWENLFNALEVRERVLLVFSASAVCYLIYFLLMGFPMDRELKNIKTQSEALDKKINVLVIEKSTLDKFIKNDPNILLVKELGELNARLADLDKELETLSVGLVPAQKMAQVLQGVVEKMDGVNMLSLHTLPVEPVSLTQEPYVPPPNDAGGDMVKDNDGNTVAASTKVANTKVSNIKAGTSHDHATVYKSGIQMTFSGRYFPTVAYLKEIEAMTWRFYWESLDYEVQDYPNAITTINLYTLSTEKGVLGGG